jgi:hypothetical protein
VTLTLITGVNQGLGYVLVNTAGLGDGRIGGEDGPTGTFQENAGELAWQSLVRVVAATVLHPYGEPGRYGAGTSWRL